MDNFTRNEPMLVELDHGYAVTRGSIYRQTPWPGGGPIESPMVSLDLVGAYTGPYGGSPQLGLSPSAARKLAAALIAQADWTDQQIGKAQDAESAERPVRDLSTPSTLIAASN